MFTKCTYALLATSLMTLALYPGCALPTDPGPDFDASTPWLSIEGPATAGLDVCPPPVPRPRESLTIVTDEDLVIRGRVEIRSQSETWNASIHTNGDLTTQGQAFLVEGYGSFSGETDTEAVCLNDPMSAEDEARCNFRPKNDWNEVNPNVFAQDAVFLPEISMEDLRPIATLTVSGSDFIIDGDEFPFQSFEDWAASLDASAGTKDEPFILLVEDANLRIRDEVHLSGYGILAVACEATCGDEAGNIFVEPRGAGGGVYGSISSDLQNTMGLVTNGRIELGPGSGVVAALYAREQLRFQGTAEVAGRIIAGEVHFSGAPILVTDVGPREIIVPPPCPPECEPCDS